ncbi:MAG: Sua5/YciO/YrdC/YwlC family protein [archaeon]
MLPIKISEAARAYETIKTGGLAIVPTRIGYILAGNTEQAMRKKFELKHRPISKPAVVITDYSNLFRITDIPFEYHSIVSAVQEQNLLCGFILHRRESEFSMIDDYTNKVSKLEDDTSCFAINHGHYSEYLVARATADRTLISASSANRCGVGNKGRFKNIGNDIINGADFAIEDDEYVAQRYELDCGERGTIMSLVRDKPVIIRKGLNSPLIEDILMQLCGTKGYDIRHGEYP